MVDRVVQPNKQRGAQGVNGAIEDTLFTTLLGLVNRSLIIGTGNPDGVVEAEQGAMYMDESAVAGDILYIKRLQSISGDKKQGWRAV